MMIRTTLLSCTAAFALALGPVGCDDAGTGGAVGVGADITADGVGGADGTTSGDDVVKADDVPVGVDVPMTSDPGMPEQDHGGPMADVGGPNEDVPMIEDAGQPNPDGSGTTEDGGGNEPDVPEQDTGAPIECELPTTFSDQGSHIIELTVLSDSAQYACDANNDGQINADDGSLNDLLDSIAGFIGDPNEQIAPSIASGDILILLELMGYDGSDIADMTTNLYLGSSMSDQPSATCGVDSDVSGVCDWNIDPDSFDEACNPLIQMPCDINSGFLGCGPADIALSLPIAGLPLDLAISTGRIQGQLSGGVNLTGGRLCGSIPKQVILDGLAAACEGPNAPSFCSLIGLISGFITCDPCTLVAGLEGVEVNSLNLGPVN